MRHKANLKAVGFWAQMHGKLELKSCNSFNDTVGAGAQLSSTVVAENTSVRNSTHSGFCGESRQRCVNLVRDSMHTCLSSRVAQL